MSARALAEKIDALLPQTQCTKCGYAGCMPYARAIAAGEADFNQCPPGGAAAIGGIAAVLRQRAKPLNPAHGAEQARRVARIDEARCIGCTLCIQACPVDAIVGTAQRMHTVIAALCTGCDLCVAPCPVDCIAMLPASGTDAVWDRSRALAARQRFEAREQRLAREYTEPCKRAAIDAAIERARVRRAAAKGVTASRLGKHS